MKSLHLTFDDKEFEKIEKEKKISGLTWHDFIIKKTVEAQNE